LEHKHLSFFRTNHSFRTRREEGKVLDWRRLTNLTLEYYRPLLSKVKLWQRALTPSKNRLCCLTRMGRTGKPRHRRGGPKGERVARVNQQAQPPLAGASDLIEQRVEPPHLDDYHSLPPAANSLGDEANRPQTDECQSAWFGHQSAAKPDGIDLLPR
jgi:hypothetical protein